MTACPPLSDPGVRAVFDAAAADLRPQLLRLRELVFQAARRSGAGRLDETLKWGQPAYLTVETGAGSTVRIDQLRSRDGVAVYFNCKTTLVDEFRQRYGDLFEFEGDRALVLRRGRSMDEEALLHCLQTALTYHRRKTAKTDDARNGGG